MMNKMKQGFTLIELMIVVAVIGVLAAIAIPQYQNYVAKAEIGAALSTLASLKTNVEDHIASNGSFPSPNTNIGQPVIPNGAFSINTSYIQIK
ncbi:MAG: pilin, partial [Plesiomonas sp.]